MFCNADRPQLALRTARALSSCNPSNFVKNGLNSAACICCDMALNARNESVKMLAIASSTLA